MTIAVAAADFARTQSRQAWVWHGAVLGGVAVALLLLFARDTAAVTHIWWTSTTFGHCLFIPPVLGWLVWQRRAELAQLTPVAWWPGLAVVAIGGCGWLLGDAAGVALARHLGLVTMLQGAVVTILGPNVARGLTFPLAYAWFMVPFGEGIEPVLQDLTVAMIIPLLHVTGVPAVVDGVLITTPTGYFEVAEACSGAKFVIAMVVYATLVANVCFTSWSRRVAFMAMALVLPILANGLRAFGTIYAAHLTSVEQATGMDHIIYGWVFFAVVMTAVIAIGWRWFDRAPDAAVFDPATLQTVPKRRTDLLVAAALVLTVAAVFPAWSGAIAGRVQALPASIALPDVPGWTRTGMNPSAPWSPNHPQADHFLMGRYTDQQGGAVDLAIAVYGSQREGKELVGFGIGPLRQDDVWVRISDLPDLGGGKAMRITAPGPVERQVVTFYRVDDTLTGSPRAVKLATLQAKLLGGPQRAVAVHLSAQAVPGQDTRATIERFARALGPIELVADRAAGMTR